MNRLGVRARRVAGVVALAAGMMVSIGAAPSSAEIAVRFESTAVVATGISSIAVDGATGEWVMAAPPRGVKREAALAQEALEADVTGQRNRLALRASSLLVLVVRPGGGAWSGQIFEGGGKDADGRPDGALLASLDSLQPLSASFSAPLDAVETSDRILAIDVDRLQGYSLVVDEEGPQTGTKEATR